MLSCSLPKNVLELRVKSVSQPVAVDARSRLNTRRQNLSKLKSDNVIRKVLFGRVFILKCKNLSDTRKKSKNKHLVSSYPYHLIFFKEKQKHVSCRLCWAATPTQSHLQK